MKPLPNRRLRSDSLTRLIPNMLTVLALCAGMSAMQFALVGSWERAVLAIVAAGVLDGLDGRIARALGATSRFGAELDSLSDFVSFGVAPAFVVYLWSLQGAGRFGWALVLLFGVCCALRLARFNTASISDEVTPDWTKNFFVGVPAPVAGGLALLPLVLGLETESAIFAHPAINGLTLICVSALMISRVPTLAVKQVRIAPRARVFVLLGIGAFAAFMISTPWTTIAVAGAAYLISIPYAMVLHRRLAEKYPEFAEEPPDLSEIADASDEDEDEDEDEEETEDLNR